MNKQELEEIQPLAIEFKTPTVSPMMTKADQETCEEVIETLQETSRELRELKNA